MTQSNDPDEIRADIERTRAELSHNVDTLGDTVNPKNIAARQVDKVKDTARSIKDSIMGSSDDPYDSGRVGDLRSAASGGVDAVRGALSQAPAVAQRKTRGNPLAAGLIAFGAGLLVSSLIPASRKEQQAVGALQEHLEPVKQQAAEVAKEMADNLREPAKQAAESIKGVATDAADTVKQQARSATGDVASRAEDAKNTVQSAGSN